MDRADDGVVKANQYSRFLSSNLADGVDAAMSAVFDRLCFDGLRV
jgi:hypothetical protein